MKSLALPIFWQMYRQLPSSVRRRAQAAYRQFQNNPQHPGLRFHRLFNDSRYWSVRVTRDYRAVRILENDTITWIWIGTHKMLDWARLTRTFENSLIGRSNPAFQVIFLLFPGVMFSPSAPEKTPSPGM